MAKKSKETESSSSPDQKALEERVDGMMDVKRTAVSEIAEDVNESLLTAPELSDESVKDTAQVDDTISAEDDDTEITAASEPVAEVTDTEPESIDNQATDKAVDDIVADESDTMLAVEDAKVDRGQVIKPPKSGLKDRLKTAFGGKIGLIVVLLFALPVTRYKILGLIIKKTVTITIIDDKTSTPVSNAQVQLAGSHVNTNASGTVKIKAGLGQHELILHKSYYQDVKTKYFVGIKSQPVKYKLIATGRLVPISVFNKITGKPLVGAQIEALNTTAKTNNKGQALVALPTKTSTAQAVLSLAGYNDLTTPVQITDKTVKANSYELTPSGQVYFLSNRSGTLDVVKSNLDGSGRKTVLQGTGSEERQATSLLASRDWRYLVLKAKRDGANASLYLIDTATDKVTQFDNNDADYTLIGWYDHNFIYSLTRNDQPYWQSGRQAIKSYDAENQQLNQLDQNQAEGGATDYAYQQLANFYIVKGSIVYTTDWTIFSNSNAAAGKDKTDTIRAVSPLGQNKKDYQSLPTDTVGYIQASLYEPNEVYFAVYNNKTNSSDYYIFQDQSVKSTKVNADEFNQGYPTYLLSPSGRLTFWSELRDGKNTIFSGDNNGASKKQLAAASDYAPYGWYSDNYLMLSKNGSELYITSPDGLQANKVPLKLTDYYKPARALNGYGYGYGGL